MFKIDDTINLFVIMALLMVVGCGTLPKNFDRPNSYAYADTDTEDTRIGKTRRSEMEAHPGQSGFLLLRNGLDAFVARAVLAEAAERSIDVQYYLYHNDLVGLLLMDQLLKAADRGVRIRILVDDMDLSGKGLGAAILDNHPNMDVRIFNPFNRNAARAPQLLTRFGSVTRRMHNKSFTVDNQVTILGGRNIGDEYFEADPDLAFSDLDVMVIGPVVDEVSTSFDRYWNSELAYPASVLYGKPITPGDIEHRRKKLDDFVADQVHSEYLDALRDSDAARRLRKKIQVDLDWGNAEVVYDQPEKILHDQSKTQYHLAPIFPSIFRECTGGVDHFFPLFCPGKKRHLVSLSIKPKRCPRSDSDQFPRLKRCGGCTCRVCQIPEGPVAGRRRTL